jgi:hypothetical protein
MTNNLSLTPSKRSTENNAQYGYCKKVLVGLDSVANFKMKTDFMGKATLNVQF